MLTYSMIFGDDTFGMHAGLDEVDCRAHVMGRGPL